MSSLFGALMEHIGSMKLAKSYGAERAHIRNFNDLSCDLEHQANRFASILSATQMYYDIGAVVIIGVFFYTAVEIFHTPASHLLVMIVLFARLAPQFSWMQRTWQNILNMLPAYGAARDMSEQFGRFAEPISSEEDAPIVLRDKVEFKNVTFRYDKNEARPVLDGLSVSFPANRTTVILGPSGGGKSTLADLTTGLLNPDSGEILVDGSPLTGELTHTWRRSTAYVPQESFLFHATLRENLLWSRPDARDEDIAEALQLASADGFIERLPEGLDTVVGDRGLRLSGGERQRIALARALLRKPTLLLLDESTSQLDGENEKRIMEALDRLRGALTIVFISHRLSALDCADNVVVLDRGRVVEQESAERVKLAANGKVTAIR
jgi:ATP-binding cassette subfamily C protein